MVGTVGSTTQKSCLWGMRNREAMNTSSLRRFHLETDSLGLKPTHPHSEMFLAPLITKPSISIRRSLAELSWEMHSLVNTEPSD